MNTDDRIMCVDCMKLDYPEDIDEHGRCGLCAYYAECRYATIKGVILLALCVIAALCVIVFVT